MSYLGETMKALREKADLSLQDVATLAGISKAHVWEMEQGSTINPSIGTLCGLARALKTEPEILCAASITDHGAAICIRSCDALREVHS